MLTYNAYGRIHRVRGPLPEGVSTITLDARASVDVRWDLVLSAVAAGVETVVAQLPGVVQLVGMAPWTGVSVGLDARGPVDPELRERRGVFRAPESLVAVTYRPGAVQVPASIRRTIDAEAADQAD